MSGIGKIDGPAVQALIAATRAMAAGGVNPADAAGPAAAGGDFASALRGALERVNTDQNRADDLQARYQLGDQSVSLEEAVIATQSASISLQGLVQVRNRLISAYHDIMNMQV